MDSHRLKRTLYPMPEDVVQRLDTEGLAEAYRQRPAYQQNDYIGWILRAKRPQTRQKRLEQMIQELRGGQLYMNMKLRK